jgi:hypothetical protein
VAAACQTSAISAANSLERCRHAARSVIFASVTMRWLGFLHRFGFGLAGFTLVHSLALAAAAEESETTGKHGREPDAPAPQSDEEEAFGHMGQVGLRAGLVLGYRMVLRYDDSPYCAAPDPLKAAKDQRKFCGHTAPLAADFGLSFGLLDFFEPFVWARLGFAAEAETDTKPLVILGAGARLYTMSDAAFKIFVEPAVALEFEDGRGSAAWQANTPEYKQDLVFHLAAGPELDFSRHFGAYATGGVTTGVLRAIHTSLDLQIGMQGRYP